MKNLALIFMISTSLLVSCSSNTSRRIASIAPAKNSDIIELDSPLKDGLSAEKLGYKEAKSHTVYDGFASAEKYKEKTTAQLVEFMAGPYKFYQVKENQTLTSIAKEIYGDGQKAQLIQSWNYEIIQNDEDLRPGMKLKYLPQSTSTRKPASK